MRIALIDPIPWDYSVWTVEERPLGGSQSALCYLAIHLAERGHEVHVFTQSNREDTYRGVRCHSLGDVDYQSLRNQPLDAAIILNSLFGIDRLRQSLNDECPLLLWSQHAVDQPAIQGLGLESIRRYLDAVICVSQWQANQYAATFSLGDLPVHILRNCVSPYFELNESLSGGNAAAKVDENWTIGYTSAPFRGLGRLLRIFPAVRASIPEATLLVYSSLKVYFETDERDQQVHGELYRQFRETDGMRLLGSLPQAKLAEQLRSLAIWAYPSTFAETSCIAALEALAAGCSVVCSDRGALRETTGGFATIVAADASDDEFATAIVEELRHRNITRHADSLEKIVSQREYIRRSFTWSRRAEDWENLLGQLQRRSLEPETEADWDELLAHGHRLHRCGLLAEAEEIYRDVLTQFPRHPDALHWLGLIAFDAGDLHNALMLIDAAIRFGPDNAEIHHHRAAILLQSGDFDSAELASRNALRIEPSFAPAQVSLGNALRGRCEFDAAITAYQGAIDRDPDFADAHNNLGVALRLAGRTHDALASYRAAIAKQPRLMQAWNNLGATHLELGQFQEALTCFGEAIALAPLVPILHANLGRVRYQLGEFDLAIECFHRSLELNPNQQDVRRELEEGTAALERLQASDNRRTDATGSQSKQTPEHG